MRPAPFTSGGGSTGTLVDAHVHLYDDFPRDAFLSAAERNLAAAARRLRIEPASPGVLLVMERGGERHLRRLRRGEPDAAASPWSFEPTAERAALRAVRDGEPRLLLIEGRQLVTAERLEVLATPCAEELAEGEPLAATLRAVRAAGALPILPWGFGKWWGRRGRLIEEALERQAPGTLCAGDNGGRPAISWKPRLLTLAAQRGFGVLRGSDPLRLRHEAARTGSFGFLLRAALDPDRPATALAELLRGVRGEPTPFGRGVGPLSFLRNQIGVRLARAAR